MQPWRAGKVYFWETVPFFRVLLPLVAGIGCYAVGMALPIFTALSVAAFFLVLYIIFAFVKQRHAVADSVGVISFHVWLFMVGWLLCYFNDVKNDAGWFGHQVNKAEDFVVRIADAPAEKDRTWKLSVEVIDAVHDGKVNNTNGKAFIYVYKSAFPLFFHKGDTVILPGKWQRIKGAGNPYEFDYAAYCARNNIYYQQFLPAKDIRLYARAIPEGINWIERLHDWCMAQLDTYIDDMPTKGLLQAMLLGDEVNLDDELRQSYTDTGIVHIIAISGGNVMILFTVIAALLWWLKNNKYLWVKYMVALPLVWIYVLMAGAPPSAVRAALMFSIIAIGFALQRNGNGINSLFAAAVVLLCAMPMWLFSVGFQLSFVAVLSLMLFYTPIYKLWTPVNRVSRTLWSVVVASLAAEILVAPVVIYYFHLFPLTFIVANVLAYLFMGVVLVLAMFIIVFSFIPVVAGCIAWLAVWLVTQFDWMIYSLQDYNPDVLHFLRLSGVELLAVFIVITAMAVLLLRKRKRALFVALGASCLLLIALCRDEWIANHQQRMVVYHMGRSNYIEIVQGKYHYPVYADSVINEKKKNYAVLPAHTEWVAWREGKMDSANILHIGNSNVLLLKDRQQYTGSFPVDYVWINKPLNDEAALSIKHTFAPQKVILAGNITGVRLSQSLAACSAAGLSAHAVGRDGAFVLEGF